MTENTSIKPRSQWGAFAIRVRRYFGDYGGWKAVLGSPFFGVSFLLAAVSYSWWLSGAWADTAIAVIPNLLGFSLGTYALLFSLMSSNMKRALKALRNSRGVTYLDEVNATFLHFIFCQVAALLWAFCYKQTVITDLAAVIAKRWPCDLDLHPAVSAVIGFFGLLLFLYSVLLAVAASMAVYRLARIVDPST